jgi:hypothetical protein
VQLYEDGKEAVKGFADEIAADTQKAIALQEKENALVFQRRNYAKRKRTNRCTSSTIKSRCSG